MSVHNYQELADHAGHEIECVTYASQNAALECLDCGCVLVDFDRLPVEPVEPVKDQSA